MKNIFFVIALLLAGSATAREIVIGQSTPLTGSNSELGKDIRDGALAYFHKVNAAGGVNGNTLKLLTLDDKNDPKVAAENARQLVVEQSALALFGYASSTLSLPSMPLVREKGVPFFAPFTGADAIRQQNDYVFTVRATYADEIEKILSYWTTFGVTKALVIHYDDAVGKQNYQTVASYLQRFDKQPISLSIKRNAEVPDAAIKTIIAADPQVVLVTTLYSPAADIIKRLKRAGKNYPISSLSFVGATQLAKAAGMTQAMTPTSLESCFAAKVLVEGIRKAGKEPSRESLKKGLEDLGRYDAGGLDVTFSPSSHYGGRFVDLAVITANGDLRN